MTTPVFSRDDTDRSAPVPRQRDTRVPSGSTSHLRPADAAVAEQGARCRQAWVDRVRHLAPQPPGDALDVDPGDTVMVIVAHADDAEVSLGDSLRALRSLGVDITVLDVSADARLTEALRARDGEGLVVRLAEHLADSERQPPAAVLTVWEHDPEPDHRTLGRATRWAARQADLPVYGYPVWAFHRSDPAAVLPADGGRVIRLDGAPRLMPEPLPELLVTM
jgi:LmbE family N-acetylglucosaminyl deacetylase